MLHGIRKHGGQSDLLCLCCTKKLRCHRSASSVYIFSTFNGKLQLLTSISSSILNFPLINVEVGNLLLIFSTLLDFAVQKQSKHYSLLPSKDRIASVSCFFPFVLFRFAFSHPIHFLPGPSLTGYTAGGPF